MKNLWLRISRYCALGVIALLSTQALAQPLPPVPFTSEFRITPQGELPKGGVTLPDAAHRDTSYYYVKTSNQGTETPFAQHQAHLYGSNDQGKSWYWLSGGFDFENLFVHPTTGELFAIIEYAKLQTREDGTLFWAPHRTALHSVDGKQWKDILAKQKYDFLSSEISVDPDHPNQVRFKGRGWNSYWIIATKDDYSEWKQIFIPLGPTF